MYVYVVVEIGVPWCACVVLPYSLEVGRHLPRARRGYEQVSTELEVKFFECMVGCSVAIGFKPVGRRCGRRFVVVQVEPYAVEQFAIIGHMAFEQGRIAAFRRAAYPFLRCAGGVYAYVCLCVGGVGVEVRLIVGIGSEQEYGFVCSAYVYCPVLAAYVPAFGYRPYPYAEFHVVVG